MMTKLWHSISIREAFRELQTDAGGLTREEADERLRQHGPNRIPSKEALTALKLLMGQLKSPLIYILLIAGVVTLVLGEHTDSIIIFVVVFLNTIIGYVQERKANQSLSKLKEALQFKVVCLRDSSEREIMQEGIVPGDIVFLRAGNKVPADGRLIEAHNLKINESALTGESVAADKKLAVLPKGAALADRDNMAYMGTVVADGWGKALITATGLHTEIGKIAHAVREAKEEKTPYQERLAYFSKIVGIIIVFVSLAIFVEGMLTGGGFVEMFTIAVAVAVAAIPEGLPVAMTVVLALGMRRILSRRGLVRRLASAETLGTTSVILTDKTGTLTEARMKVAGVFAGEKELLASREVFVGKFLEDGRSLSALEDLGQKSAGAHMLALEIGMLCNESFVENMSDPTEQWIVRGRPTEKPLFMAAIQAGLPIRKLQKEKAVLDRSLFDPAYGYAASLHKAGEKSNVLYMVGSPEKLLTMSSYLQSGGRSRKMFLGDLKRLKNKQEILTRHGYRVVAAARRETRGKEIDRGEEEKAKKMVFVGFFALHDPIRSKTDRVINTCRQAGMKPIIVTGDHRLTALAVARKLGFKTGKENVLEGKDLANMTDREFAEKFRSIQVYARVEPIQKLRIVQFWQKAGEVVAMTGDGVNDAPALKQADIGVALGSGTDVAKEVSDLVLLKDNFRTIKSAIEEGRAMVDNIRKIITFLLSDSFTEVILVSVGLFFGLPLPILAGQILWVNLIEDGPLGICLAFEKREKDVMKKKPKDYSLFLLNREMKAIIFIIGIVTDVLLLGLFFLLLKYSGYEIGHIRSVIFAGLTIDSLFYIFSCKSLRRSVWHIKLWDNRFLIAAWFFGIVMLLAALYLPVLQLLLKTVPLNARDWGMLCTLGLINLFLIELTKSFFIRRHRA